VYVYFVEWKWNKPRGAYIRCD